MWSSGRVPIVAMALLLIAAACETASPPLEGVRVSDVRVRHSATVAATAVSAGLRDSMMAILPGCAAGGAPHVAAVEILSVRRDRKTGILRNGDVTITAEITFVRQETGQRTRPYQVTVNTAGTSLPGAPAGNPESQLGNLFAAAICREVFGTEPEFGG